MDRRFRSLNPLRLTLAGLMTAGAAVCHAAAVPDVTAVARANNAFGVDLYRQLASGDANLFFSPYSISIAFGMAGAGAGGETADQIGRVLHLGESPLAASAGLGALQQLLNTVSSAEEVELAVANSLWPEQTYRFRPDYLSLLEDRFRVSVSACDFKGQPDLERRRINQWVEAHTQNRIQDLLPDGSVTTMTRLVLANAVYFKGGWAEPFEDVATKEASFSTRNQNQVSVPMMSQTSSFRYGEHPDLQVLVMPYDGHALSMVVLLPRSTNGLEDLERDLSLEKLDEWTDGLRLSKVVVQFPKFRSESTLNLKQSMQDLGMTDAWLAGRADFSRMSDRNDLFISDAVHKAFVEVTEEGTEAAAATAVSIRTLGIEAPPPLFRADHPFLYFIRHEESGTILFMGRMTDPSA